MDWFVSHGRHFTANIIIWRMRKHYSTLEVHTILLDADFENLVYGEMHWEGNHLRVVLTVKNSKAIDKSKVIRIEENMCSQL